MTYHHDKFCHPYPKIDANSNLPTSRCHQYFDSELDFIWFVTKVKLLENLGCLFLVKKIPFQGPFNGLRWTISRQPRALVQGIQNLPRLTILIQILSEWSRLSYFLYIFFLTVGSYLSSRCHLDIHFLSRVIQLKKRNAL